MSLLLIINHLTFSLLQAAMYIARHLDTEIKILEYLDHPNIIKLLQVDRHALYSNTNGTKVRSLPASPSLPPRLSLPHMRTIGTSSVYYSSPMMSLFWLRTQW